MTSRLFQQARRYIAGGVNSPVRAFRAVGGEPVFIRRGAGSRVWDSEGREYIDYLGSWGPLILGHCHPRIIAALEETCEAGTSFGMPTEIETELARRVAEAFRAVETLRFVNSGTEATMSALRLARAFTGRELIVKMAGCYHGHADSLLVKAGSGVATFGIAGSPGVPEALAALTLTIPFNDAGAFEKICENKRGEIACVILEAVAGNMGVIPPARGWLEAIRELSTRHGILFICDEVMTGFRVAFGGAQERYGFTADLVTMGKILGGGLPVGAYGGRSDIMDQLAPDGPVYQAGTLSGNPLAMRAGIETLELLCSWTSSPTASPAAPPCASPAAASPARPSAAASYDRLEALASGLEEGLLAAAAEAGEPVKINRVGSMMTLFFTRHPVTDYDSALACDTDRFAAFFRGMLSRGVFLPPSQFEALFVSLAHTEEDIDRTVEAARAILGELRDH
ncbi:MAG: aspartate aminotransferase family protein [Acidobacteria bacterium]|nr:MAG: aspartate aminotransferase family protein [Acidobacteriota bacterium]